MTKIAMVANQEGVNRGYKSKLVFLISPASKAYLRKIGKKEGFVANYEMDFDEQGFMSFNPKDLNTDTDKTVLFYVNQCYTFEEYPQMK